MTKALDKVEPRWCVIAYYNWTGSYTILGEYKWWIVAALRVLYEGGMGWHAIKIEKRPITFVQRVDYTNKASKEDD